MSRSGFPPLVEQVSVFLAVLILLSLLDVFVVGGCSSAPSHMIQSANHTEPRSNHTEPSAEGGSGSGGTPIGLRREEPLPNPPSADGSDDPSSSSPETTPPVGKIVEFAPGVRIDWPDRRVEIEGMVVLRDGPLELFACTQGTREHESIVVVRPRPLHVYQAMGMLGLEPGEPSRYEQETNKIVPPTGEALSVQVRVDGQPTVPIEAWMWDIEHDRPLGVTNWVFCGSRKFEGGRFGADLDGTVICVVDFDTALIAPGASHSADNEALWLHARSDRIPERGTRCVILLEKLQQTTLSVEVGAAGELLLEGQPTDAADLTTVFQARSAAERLSRVHLTVRDRADPALVQRVEADLAKLGLTNRLVRSAERRRPDSTGTNPAD